MAPRRRTPSPPPPSQRRWSWWDQTRDVVASITGIAIIAVESIRGTYHPVAMAVAATFILGAAAGVGVRRILTGNGNGK